MANENLSGATVVLQNDIPQTYQESQNISTVVLQNNIPQTSQESQNIVTPVIYFHVPETLQERIVSLAMITGQNDDNRQCILTHNGCSVTNQSNSSSLWIHHGCPIIIKQPNIPKYQL